MVDYLDDKFKDSDPTFYFKTIDCSVLDEERTSIKLKDFETVDGSSSFHAILFKPGVSTLTAATQISICESCKGEYGLCDEFMEYPIPNVTQLNKMFLRSNTENATTVAQEVDETVAGLLVPGSFVSIAANTNSIDTVWFIQIVESNCVGDGVLCDDYSHKIAA